MTQSAKVVADSVSPLGIRLTTVQLRYPKFIHGELMTHRVLSRNASSSRAIPVARLIEDVMTDPAMPIHWGKNQRGMQAGGDHNEMISASPTSSLRYTAREAWLAARDQAVAAAEAFDRAGYHKQVVNRIIEPWCHINVVVTSTDWSNFFALRCHPDAQPEMRDLTEKIRDAMDASTPISRRPGEWHLPYVGDEEWKDLLAQHIAIPEHAFDVGKRISVARCARVSYLTQDGKTPSISDDLKLYDRLVGSVPLHASPAEHQATPDEIYIPGRPPYPEWKNPHLHGNFRGWVQFRKTLPGESQ